jgi:hypothetical protein
MVNLFKKSALAAGALGIVSTVLFSTALAQPPERIPAPTDGGLNCVALSSPTSVAGEKNRIVSADATGKKPHGSVKEYLPNTVTIDGQKYRKISGRGRHSGWGRG